MRPVKDIDGNTLSDEEQMDWLYADSIGLRPSEIRFLAGKPFAVFKDGTGIYGPCLKRPSEAKP